MLEDDVYSFGFILLEALVGPSVSAKREAAVLNVLVCTKNMFTTSLTQNAWKRLNLEK